MCFGECEHGQDLCLRQLGWVGRVEARRARGNRSWYDRLQGSRGGMLQGARRGQGRPRRSCYTIARRQPFIRAGSVRMLPFRLAGVEGASGISVERYSRGNRAACRGRGEERLLRQEGVNVVAQSLQQPPETHFTRRQSGVQCSAARTQRSRGRGTGSHCRALSEKSMAKCITVRRIFTYASAHGLTSSVTLDTWKGAVDLLWRRTVSCAVCCVPFSARITPVDKGTVSIPPSTI